MSAREQIIDAVADTGMTKTTAREAVDAVFAVIAGELRENGEVRIVGFGRFAVKDFPARPGRNPRTGETIEIAARRRIVFKPGTALRDALNQPPAAQRRRA